MNRREFLGSMAAAPIVLRGAVAARSASRTFEITTKVELEESHDAAIAWLPLPLARTAPYQIDRGHTVSGNAERHGSSGWRDRARRSSSPTGGT